VQDTDTHTALSADTAASVERESKSACERVSAPRSAERDSAERYSPGSEHGAGERKSEAVRDSASVRASDTSAKVQGAEVAEEKALMTDRSRADSTSAESESDRAESESESEGKEHCCVAMEHARVGAAKTRSLQQQVHHQQVQLETLKTQLEMAQVQVETLALQMQYLMTQQAQEGMQVQPGMNDGQVQPVAQRTKTREAQGTD
jgi:hypothetical protein